MARLYKRLPDGDSLGDAHADAANDDGTVVDHLGAAVALLSADDGEILYTNDRWDLMFGYARDEAVGRHISVVNAATDQTPGVRAGEIFDALARDGVWNGELHNLRKDESDFWTFCSVTRFDHPEHGPVWLSVNTDITARRVADERLRESEQRYRRLFESSPAPLALIGDDLRLSLVNRAFADLLGYRRDRLERTPLPDLTHPDDLAGCIALRTEVLNGGSADYRLEERLRSAAGEWLPVVLTGTVIRGDDGVPVADVITIERLDGGSS